MAQPQLALSERQVRQVAYGPLASRWAKSHLSGWICPRATILDGHADAQPVAINTPFGLLRRSAAGCLSQRRPRVSHPRRVAGRRPLGIARRMLMSAKDLPVSRFPVPKLADMPTDIRERIEAVQEKSGFIPNVFLVLAHRPEEFRAFFAYHDALMDKPGNLTKAEREMIVVSTSNVNQCQYCVVAHGAILRIRAKDPLIADQVAINYRKADITDRQKAMLDFAMKVSQSAQLVGEADLETLKAHGFDEEDAWDIAAIAAFFGMSNRLANVTSMRPNREFYTMGRA
jgi:uncharacterized peroxidase-related enzyme